MLGASTMQAIAVLLVVLCQSIHVGGAFLCPPDYMSQSGQCYRYLSIRQDWQSARSYCQGQYSGDLLIIKSESLKYEVWSHTQAIERELWIGASSPNKNSGMWLDGTSIPSQWWLGGEPSSDSEKCVEVRFFKGNTGLNDKKCDLDRDVVCEASACFSIANCISGTRCKWNSNYFDRNVCETCRAGYYNAGHGNGCKVCNSIPNCQRETCTTATDQTCLECHNNNVYFKLMNNNRTCDRMCASNGHYCWPGLCSNELIANCACAGGFKRVASSQQTVCQPDTKPEVDECRTVFIEPNGEKKDTFSKTNSTECQFLQDVYGNFQIAEITFNMTSEFAINITNITKPSYIQTEKFGITDTKLVLQKISTSEQIQTSSFHSLTTDTTFRENAERVVHNNGVLAVNESEYKLVNGERLCVQYKAHAGGFLETFDIYTNQSKNVAYDETETIEIKCYKFDSSPPEHCSERNICQTEPLELGARITRSGIVSGSFSGWTDHVPNPNIPDQASGIDHFKIRVSETITAGEKLKVCTDEKTHEERVTDVRLTSFTLNLTVSTPKLFCILLEVKDVADNVRQARRFVLSDSSSYLEVSEDHPFHINSASYETAYLWQSNLNSICLTWKEHFFNRYYLHNNLLLPVEADPHGLVEGIYEQINGILSVNGTLHVHGITKYLVAWRLNSGQTTGEIEVKNFLYQNFCRNFLLEDGQTYTFIVTAVDIVDNVLSKNRTVHIDHSAPHINEIGIINDGFRGLVVHNDRDLSEMKMYFEALDPHSGLLNIEWWFGIEDTGEELGSGKLGIQRITENCHQDVGDPSCYCPDIGLCENHGYIVPLNGLVASHSHHGDHHRHYLFKIKATNIAHLSTTEHKTILVDYSPPEVGVIQEGSVDGRDIDYTSANSVMVQWKGFIDHESGISLYRVGFARRCLRGDELYNHENISDIEVLASHTETSVRLNADFIGKMYTSIIAFNNAMDPSDSVCSDGIVRDITPPEIYNFTIEHASTTPSIVCINSLPWILNSNLSVSQLPLANECTARCCQSGSFPSHGNALPRNKNVITSSKETHLCYTLPVYTTDTIMYLPNDHLHLEWDIVATESQIDDFYIGIGLDPSEGDSPQLITYSSTNRKLTFKHRHEGIYPGEIFYIFLKAVSKSGLESILTIGPVLIDSTPPLNKGKPDVKISEGFAMIIWREDTFFDLEQTEQINRIEYILASNSKTERYKWDLMTQQPCGNVSCCCIKYELAKLQEKDADLGIEFVVRMFVYNNAGHFTVVDTDPFEVPSRYPPAHAIVYDVDPVNYTPFDLDIDTHFTPGTLCASWSSYKYQNVRIEVGIGLTNTEADIIPFQENLTPNTCCVNSSEIKVGQKYYFLLKAITSGGSTVSSSNGISIFDASDLKSKITVYSGTNCDSQNPLEQLTIDTITYSDHFQFDIEFEIGGLYLITIEAVTVSSPTISLTSDDILIIPEHSPSVYFSSYIDRPTFVLLEEKQTSNQSKTLSLFRCPSSKSISAHLGLTTYWTAKIDSTLFHIWYESAIIQVNSNSSTVSEFERTYNMTHTFRGIAVHPFVDYQFAIKPCTTHTCLDAILSDSFRVELEQPTGAVDLADLQSSHNKSCFDLTISWDSFKTDSDILFYQWTISKDDLASHIVIPWTTVERSDIRQIAQCIGIQSHAFAKLFGCVRAFSLAGSQTIKCKAVSAIRSGAYKVGHNVVYDLDYRSESWKSVLNVIHSLDLGHEYTLLHDSELDIVSANSGIAGAILGMVGRTITWYLMTSPRIPDDCTKDDGCAFFEETENGYSLIPDDAIEKNTFYFICAHANEAIHSEFAVTEFSSCSNGFIIDDEPPLATSISVYVTNFNGFVTETSRLVIKWDKFKDNVNTSAFGIPENIQSYIYGIGHSPGKDDIKNFENTRHSTVAVSRGLNIKDGAAIYATVKACDYAGLETTIVSEELIVDTSPPEIGLLFLEPEMIELDTVNYISTDYIILHMYKFEDKESGISHYELGVGTSRYFNNILPLSRYHDDKVRLELEDKNVQDGHTHFINLKVTNNAGLGSNFITVKFIVDKSPPTGGHVIDGQFPGEPDEDYSNDRYRVHGNWKGFLDPHSHVHFYRCGFGTAPYMDNIRQLRNIGLNQATEWTGPFVSGETYYTTVEACNHAGLCRKVSSNGIVLDNSAPIGGLVYIGADDFHHKFYPHSHWLHIHWVGFEDPHSGIDHYQVCVGTTLGGCNTVKKIDYVLETNILKTELDLPVNIDMFATVTAFNKVGMNVSCTSDSFRIDITPPVLVHQPRFHDPLSFEDEVSVHWEKSVLKVSWLFTDPESPIISHEIALLTHHDGHIPREHVHLGSENNCTISLPAKEWLHNGDIYYVKITSCNAAGLCTTNQSKDIRIDSTPPHVGGFKKPLKWTNYNNGHNVTRTNLTLTWHGFYDQESPINHFYITVSRTYSGQELTNGYHIFKVENTAAEYVANIPLVDYIKRDELLVLSIWAENQAALMSSVAHVSVYTLSETSSVDDHLIYGKLEIEKHSCDIHYCNKDCTCAVLGQPCIHAETNTTCNEIESSDLLPPEFPTISVQFGFQYKEYNISSSSACLTGSWKFQSSDEMAIKRFEWSMGLSNEPIGEGIFDLNTEQPWTDIGTRKQITYCLPVNRSLLHTEHYVLYVRAWYTKNIFATFNSDAIIIDQSPPAVRRGQYIKDSDTTCVRDFDFIDWTDSVTGCWSDVFSEHQGEITHYIVAFGTSYHADDIFERTNVGIHTNITLSNVSLTHGARYYFTVTAHNSAGLSTSLSSDGFQVDTDTPLEGIVFNSLLWQNREFQSSCSSFNISWSGFTDHYSGINQYYVAVSTSNYKETVDSLTFTPIVLKTSHTFAGLNLHENKTYYGVVKASDAAGHFSDTVFSPGITIDITKPSGHSCKIFDKVANSTYQLNKTSEINTEFILNMTKGDIFLVTLNVDSGDYHTKIYINTGIEKTFLYPLRIHDDSLQFQCKLFGKETATKTVVLTLLSTQTSRVEYIASKCTNVEEDENNAISVAQIGLRTVSIDMMIGDTESDICSLELGAGTTIGGFQIQSLKQYHPLKNHVTIQTHAEHGSMIYVTAMATNCAGLKSTFKASPITMDHTPHSVDDVHTSVRIETETVNGTTEAFVTIEAMWKVEDGESDVKYCFCALETHHGARDISPFWKADELTTCSFGKMQLQTHTSVYLVLKCANQVELYTVYSTAPHMITYEPPSTMRGKVYILPSDKDNIPIYDTNVGTFLQTNRSVVKFGWTKFEDDSEIKSYDYRLSLEGTSVADWQSIKSRDVVHLHGLNLNAGSIYSADVKATNVNGMTSDIVSANIVILEETPRITGKTVSIIVLGNQMSLDWTQVFTTLHEIPMSYHLVIGTKKGYADVIDVGPLVASSKSVTVPSSTLLTPHPAELFISISCVYPFGLAQVYEKTYKL